MKFSDEMKMFVNMKYKLKIDNVLKNEFNNIISEDSIVTEYIPENEHSCSSGSADERF